MWFRATATLTQTALRQFHRYIEADTLEAAEEEAESDESVEEIGYFNGPPDDLWIEDDGAIEFFGGQEEVTGVEPCDPPSSEESVESFEP